MAARNVGYGRGDGADQSVGGGAGAGGRGGRPVRSTRPTGRIVLAAGLLPTVVVGASLALIASWRTELPDPIATHWGADGRADGFASFGGLISFTAGFGLVWVLLGLLIALTVRVPVMARFAAGVGGGTGGFVAALGTLSVVDQRGMVDAADSEFAWWVIPATMSVGLLVGLVAAALVPRWATERTEHGGDPGHPVELSPSERVFWARTVASSKAAFLVLAIAIPGTAVPVLFTRQWSLLSITLALLALMALIASVRVTVDDGGLLVRGALRWPRVRIALEDVATARVVSVRALRDFGGYGFRVGFRGEVAGASGFVLRSGEALLVERRDGARTVVVVDDAATAAGLLNALVERAA